jgi:type II secretory pathway component PulF
MSHNMSRHGPRNFYARRREHACVSLVPLMKLSEKALLYRELAKLVGADFHLDRSIDLMLKQQPSHARRTWLQGLQLGLKEGLGVAASITEHCGAFSDALEFALIDAGERSGRLGDAFSHLARYFEAWDMAVRQALGAMIYPLVLAHLGIVLPELPTMVTASMEGRDLAFSGIFMPLAILWLVILSLFLLWRWLSRLGATSAAVDRWLGRIPLIGGVRRHWALARFSQVFHACLLASMRMTECMLLAGGASHSGMLRHASRDAAQRIAAGETIAGAMADVHGFPLVFVHGTATAEEAGTLDHEMNRWAAAEAIEAGDAVQRAAQWLPKIAYGIVVMYVAYRIITMMTGYYGGMMKQIESL